MTPRTNRSRSLVSWPRLPCGRTVDYAHGVTAESRGDLTHGFWFCAYLDLVGIRRAFMQTDVVPTDDAATLEQVMDGLRASVGAIRDMRKRLASCFEGLAHEGHERTFKALPPAKRALAAKLRKTRIRRDAASDGSWSRAPW